MDVEEFYKIVVEECMRKPLDPCTPDCKFYCDMDYPGVRDCFVTVSVLRGAIEIAEKIKAERLEI